MSAARRIVLVCSLVLCCFALSSCGGGSNNQKVSSQPPIFTSTPNTTAAQGQAYSYQVAATDPSGGSLTYALTTAPTGATISGSAISWTPTAAQSRTGNTFTVTATTSENATNTQSWTVSPTGIVTVNWINTYWGPNGPVQLPASPTIGLSVSAVVPESDGSITVLKGATSSPGVVSIAGVPAGNYWLAFGGPNLLPDSTSAYWTSTNTFDAGHDIPGTAPTNLNSETQTQFAVNLSGLASVNSYSSVVFNPETQTNAFAFFDPSNTTTLTSTAGVDGYTDWTQVNTVFLGQYTPGTLGSFTDVVLGPSALVTGVSFSNGTTNSLTQTLSAGSPVSWTYTVQGSQWASTLSGTAPVTPSNYYSGFGVAAEPFVTGVNAPGSFSLLTPSIILAVTSPNNLGIAPIPLGLCDNTGPILNSFNTQPAITTDQTLGTLTYQDSFPSTWTRAESFCEEAVIPMPVPNSSSTVNFALVSGASTAPSNAAQSPVVGPVQTPTIGGASLYSAATLTSTTPTLSWSAPASGSPYGYRVNVYVATTPVGIPPQYASAGVFYASQTSVTLPPLSAGNTYLFAITALVDAASNVQTAPFRSALPTGYASVVSAPMTVTSGAAQARIHGDAGVIRQFSQPQQKPPVRQ